MQLYSDSLSLQADRVLRLPFQSRENDQTTENLIVLKDVNKTRDLISIIIKEDEQRKQFVDKFDEIKNKTEIGPTLDGTKFITLKQFLEDKTFKDLKEAYQSDEKEKVNTDQTDKVKSELSSE